MKRLLLAFVLFPLAVQAQAPEKPAQDKPSPDTHSPDKPSSEKPGGDKGMSPADTWLPRGTADLILLDKLRGQPTPITVRTGQSAEFETLTITLRSCVARPPDLPQNAAAFIDVTDSKNTAPLFRGWILSNTPAVHQLEHPIYDLRLVTCR